MIRSLQAMCPDSEVRGFATADEWVRDEGDASGGHSVILYQLGGASVSDPEVKEQLRTFIEQAGEAQVIVLAQSEDVTAIFDAMECGAASYMPPSVLLEELVEAIRLSSSGGIYVQRKSFLALRGAVKERSRGPSMLEKQFTDRQLAVARALRRGAANKTIAYELNLCESTVKVHIRNIMKKLNATNRTQAAYRLNALSLGEE